MEATIQMTEACRAEHFGPWMIDARWMMQAVDAVRRGLMVPATAPTTPPATPYQLQDGVAIIGIEGPMMKIRSKFGGTSTVDVRAALRAAAQDGQVGAILLLIDSPGGTVAGTDALAREVKRVDAIKPVHAHIQDLGASAAYYVASQARRITAEPTSLVGSLGVMMTIVDESKSADMKGLKVLNVSSGGMKGAGTPGTEVTPDQLAYFQKLVDDAAGHFKAAVRGGRGSGGRNTDAWFDGRVHDAEKAREMGLLDGVETVDAALASLRGRTGAGAVAARGLTAPRPASTPRAAPARAAGAATTQPTTDDPATIAGREWDHQRPAGFSTRERYVAWRTAELKGMARRFKLSGC